jgi:hypothetical protein
MDKRITDAEILRKYDAPERIGVAGDLGGIVGILADARVEVILIGGLVAQAHGSTRLRPRDPSAAR